MAAAAALVIQAIQRFWPRTVIVRLEGGDGPTALIAPGSIKPTVYHTLLEKIIEEQGEGFLTQQLTKIYTDIMDHNESAILNDSDDDEDDDDGGSDDGDGDDGDGGSDGDDDDGDSEDDGAEAPPLVEE